MVDKLNESKMTNADLNEEFVTINHTKKNNCIEQKVLHFGNNSNTFSYQLRFYRFERTRGKEFIRQQDNYGPWK